MKKIILLALVFTLTHQSSMADEPYAVVKKIQADAKFNGQTLVEGQKIDASGKIETGVASFVVLEFLKQKDFMRVQESSSPEIAAPVMGEQLVKVQSGTLRIQVEKSTAQKIRFNVRSSAATMGVRGTDFYVKAEPVLGETELIVFDGTVAFTATKDIKDTKLVHKGRWGGIGGRFGEKTSAILTLPLGLLKTVNDSTALAL